MRAPPKLAFYAFLLLSAGSCDCGEDDSNDPVIVKAREGVDFAAYQTFHIAEVPSPLPPDAGAIGTEIPANVRLNISSANDQARIELEALGLTVAAPGIAADLEVASLGSASSESGYYWECVPGYWWGYWGWVWDPCAWTVPVPVSYAVGSVMVVLSDPKLQQAVFGGLVQGVADGEGDANARIRDGVHRMFQAYPAPPK
jgi:hypothetical protein